ncbi:MAG: hypothetical protein GC159_20045 [Phycisphaera sp.]|nr:hypothetical protein [Phycisphaera sp.]
MAATFKCSVVTPEQAVFEDEVVYANVPAHDGQIGVLRDRAPMVVQLGNGNLELKLPSGNLKRYALEGGFAQMVDNRLTLLSEKASEV